MIFLEQKIIFKKSLIIICQNKLYNPIVILVLGDNRNDSFDAHVWGYLPEENIVDKAYKIYWSPQHLQAL